MSAVGEIWDTWPVTEWIMHLSVVTGRSIVHVFVSEEVCTSNWSEIPGLWGSYVHGTAVGEIGDPGTD